MMSYIRNLRRRSTLGFGRKPPTPRRRSWQPKPRPHHPEWMIMLQVFVIIIFIVLFIYRFKH